MVVRPQYREIKNIVRRNLLDLGVPALQLFGLKETILTEGDECLARAYRAGGYRAVWSLDEGTVKFYDTDDRLLRIVNLLAKKTRQLLAA